MACAVSPTLTPIAVTMPGHQRHSSMIGMICMPAESSPSPARERRSALLARRPAFSRAICFGEALARHLVHAEGRHHLAQDVVGRHVAVLERRASWA